MQKTVFVLGAGASHETGGPLMSTFLDTARDHLAAGHVNDRKEDFERVFKALVRLREVFYKSGLDLDNIESVFGAFEMARTIGKLGEYSGEEIATLVKSVRWLIVRTLDGSISYLSTHGGHPVAQGYNQFANLIAAISRSAGDRSACSVLTFNYDIALDYTLVCSSMPLDYCLDSPPENNRLRLLKLHGSLNWSKCPKCDKIRAAALAKRYVFDLVAANAGPTVTLPSGGVMAQAQCEVCQTTLAEEPVIVPPTWNKIEGHNELAAVWKQAAVELGQAENIVCMGYSLPDSDLFFRYLFALGTVGDANIRRFWVFDPDPEGVVEQRYRRLIGRGIERRFQFFKGKDGQFTHALRTDGVLHKSLSP